MTELLTYVAAGPLRNVDAERSRAVAEWIRRDVPGVDPRAVYRVEIWRYKGKPDRATFHCYVMTAEGNKIFDRKTRDTARRPPFQLFITTEPFPEDKA